VPVSPLAPREGISATRLRAPGGHQTHALAEAPVPDSVGAWLRETFPEATDSDLLDLVTEGRLSTSAGVGVDLTDSVIPGEFYWFHRPVPLEERVPFEIGIVHEDSELLVVDKPHFLASTPNGRFVRECAVTRLRVERDEPDLVAIHRLDRVTAGLLVLSRRPETRGIYQRLFQDRMITKTYRALAELPPVRQDVPDEPNDSSSDGRSDGARPAAGAGRSFPFEYASRLEKTKGERQVREVPGAPNAVTWIDLVRRFELEIGDSAAGLRSASTGGRSPGSVTGPSERSRTIGEFELRPLTGKTHQLRAQMNALGMPILGDPVYPVDLAPDPYDFSSPLQLLASRLEFRDPLTGELREFETRLDLGADVIS
jgi:tRNA pseudouridine32 synthase / 23S rRNA pseudouridine746 synthase